ncbi:MAG: NYN domain-containing protein [Verrucomicrobiaceae bacterium]|nr:MAG: NYN domain-containing protein [Verrucomicrobiaceae bacterium]
MTTTQNSIALLIDADNAPSSKIDFIISELAGHGVVNIRRAYGNWTKQGLAGWREVLHDYSIQAMQSFDLVKGKNATDISLVVDAMDMLYTRNVDTFCLVSSDCDFTPLMQRLRADGKHVIGFGERKTPEAFINSCSEFLYLDEKIKGGAEKENSGTTTGSVKPDGGSVKDPQSLKGNTRLMNTLRSAVKESLEEDGWARLGPVGSRISNAGPFDHRTYGYKKLSDLFSAIDLFEVKKETNGGQTVILVKMRKGAAKVPAVKVAKKAAKEKLPGAGE